MSLRLTPFNEDNALWIQDWTIFYWAWWIAWAPFVGMFIARVSRGRTVRDFVIVVLAVPTIFSALWFAVFGGSGLFFEQFKNAGIYEATNDGANVENALFALFNEFPLSLAMSLLAILLISTFFITSADSATFVLGMQTTNGDLKCKVNMGCHSVGIGRRSLVHRRFRSVANRFNCRGVSVCVYLNRDDVLTL
jgi:glycine betaine transporter